MRLVDTSPFLAVTWWLALGRFSQGGLGLADESKSDPLNVDGAHPAWVVSRTVPGGIPGAIGAEIVGDTNVGQRSLVSDAVPMSSSSSLA
jgi:hypothetical protein